MDKDLRKIGNSKYRFLTENKIEWIVSSWWDIEYDFASLNINLEVRGIDSDVIKEIIIRFEKEVSTEIEEEPKGIGSLF